MTGSENPRDSRGGGSHRSLYEKIIARENIFAAWREFQNGKTRKSDVLIFSENFESHLLDLHRDLANATYRHGGYQSFVVCDPKRRDIHKACVRDRVLHHAIVRILTPIFDKTFIFDSYSSRKGKGTHKAIDRLRNFASKLSRNNTRSVWVLKCDVRKFFDSIDHDILLKILSRKCCEEKFIGLLSNIIASYNAKTKRGLPLGNLTSQLFSNVYMNEFDQFVKRKLRSKYYVRYADDFAILSNDRQYLEQILPELTSFLAEHLKLVMHDRKIVIEKWHCGIDFLGFVHFPHFSLVRTKTKQRIFKKLAVRQREYSLGKISADQLASSVQSYLGVLGHSRNKRLILEIKSRFPIISPVGNPATQISQSELG